MTAMAKTKETPEARLDRMDHWVRNQRILSLLMFCGIAIIGIGEVVKNGSEVLIAMGLKTEKALEMANNSAKGELSRKLTELGWRRISWTRNFVRRVESGRPQEELDYSWNKLMDSIADWSADYVVLMNAIDEYYPRTGKLGQLEDIQNRFLELEQPLVALRQTPSKNDIQNIKGKIDELNEKLYFFALAKHAPK